MRKEFWKKLANDQRNFKWFYDNHVKNKVGVGVKYNTLYIQAKGEFLTTMDDGLKQAIRGYLNGTSR